MAQCVEQGGDLGCVAVLDEMNCPSGPSNFANGVNSCMTLSVQSPGVVPAILVELRITDPLPGVSLKGTVLLGSRGLGNIFYEDQVVDGSGANGVVQRLLDEGFRIVQRKWDGDGWFAENLPTSSQYTGQNHPMTDLANRYATLLHWVSQNSPPDGAMIATGQSNGSSEIAYALSTWGAEEILDVAVLSSGPTMTYLDEICGSAPCGGAFPANVLTCSEPCPVAGIEESSAFMAVCIGTSTAEQMDGSILFPGDQVNPGADTSYISSSGRETRTHIIIGSDDCPTVAPQMGFAFFDAITSEKVLEFVPATGHTIQATIAGKRAIVNAVLAGASAASLGRVATISLNSWGTLVPDPSEFEVQLHGPEDALTFLLLSVVIDSEVEIGLSGWLFLPSAFLVQGVGSLIGNGKNLTFEVPNDCTLQNIPIYFQAMYFYADGQPGTQGELGVLSNTVTLVVDVGVDPCSAPR